MTEVKGPIRHGMVFHSLEKLIGIPGHLILLEQKDRVLPIPMKLITIAKLIINGITIDYGHRNLPPISLYTIQKVGAILSNFEVINRLQNIPFPFLRV